MEPYGTPQEAVLEPVGSGEGSRHKLRHWKWTREFRAWPVQTKKRGLDTKESEGYKSYKKAINPTPSLPFSGLNTPSSLSLSSYDLCSKPFSGHAPAHQCFPRLPGVASLRSYQRGPRTPSASRGAFGFCPAGRRRARCPGRASPRPARRDPPSASRRRSGGGAALMSGRGRRRGWPRPRCGPPCSCWRESALCVGAAGAPRSLPAGLGSLSLVNGTFSEVKDRMFSHLPSLQLLLLNSNSFTVIRDDAFAGLFHLEYLFIEGNKIETISRNAFRGLRDLTHLSLANNHLKALPRDVFSDLDSLIELDLRGNKFECDCKAKWLFLWLKMTNSTVSDVLCIGPAEYQDKKLNDVTSFDYECTTTDFVVHQILPYHSVSVDTFNSKNDVFVAIAQPSMENCMVLEWDHIEMNFRSYDNITGQSIVGCKAVLVGDQVFVVVAQLFGGSHIYKFDESWTKFVKFQDIEESRISKPNDIELFEIDSEMFFVIADSSKAGLSTVYKWNNKGFYSYQSLHEWFRDTDAEFLDIDGKSYLILSSRSQVPIILQWNKASKKFVPHGEIPNMEDVLAVKSFRIQDDLYITLTRFIGDSRVMKWNSKQFVEIQALPSRGAMTLQPFSFKNNYYLALGSDYTFSQIYQWDGEKKIFRLFKEIYVQAPRSFTAVSTDRRDFFFASSFKGNTQIFEHIIIDLSL
ncbi:leucine-rich repeat LGI family member 2 [Pyrgilauda ruficollis]|uniref:leucine-rich repeat LGI family member 2 n=1 Tax=Pyrgilauda ruficollis TaxID=221976 RepID=UPI001B8732B1|nr:leucine-rich repeat LGI family member 2 [Pyrgilauda ruficollis]